MFEKMENFSLKIYCDGGARGNPGPAASSFVVEKQGKVIHKESKFLGTGTNNVAEYNAVVLAVNWLDKNFNFPGEKVLVVLDSELVARQLSGTYKIKNENLRNLFYTIKNLEEKISTKIIYISVPRSKNKIADFLVNKTLDENTKSFHVSHEK